MAARKPQANPDIKIGVANMEEVYWELAPSIEKACMVRPVACRPSRTRTRTRPQRYVYAHARTAARTPARTHARTHPITLVVHI